MLKRDEVLNPDSNLNKAAPDEPIFVLLGRDTAAYWAIMSWVDKRISLGLNSRYDAEISETVRFANEMINYAIAKVGAVWYRGSIDETVKR